MTVALLGAKIEEKAMALAALKTAAKMEKEFGGSSSLSADKGKLAIKTVSLTCELNQYIGEAKGDRKCGIDAAATAKFLSAAGGRKDLVQICSMDDKTFELDVADKHEYNSAPVLPVHKDFNWEGNLLETFVVPKGEVAPMLKHTLPYVYGESHPVLNGNIEVAACARGFRIVGTDGYRMGIAEYGDCDLGEMSKVVLPGKTLNFLDEKNAWMFELYEDSVFIDDGHTNIRVKTNKREYPDVERIRVKEFKASVWVPASDFAEQIKPLYALASDVDIFLQRALGATATSNDKSSAQTGWDVASDQRTGDTDQIKAMLNGSYLNKMAQSFKGKGIIEFRWNSEIKPVSFLLHAAGNKVRIEHTIMPLSPKTTR